MKVKQTIVTVLLVLRLFALVRPSRAADLVLVEDGVCQVPIVVFKDAPPYTRNAAEELAGYIKKITGVEPDVIEGEPAPIPKQAIWIGYQPQEAKLFPEYLPK